MPTTQHLLFSPHSQAFQDLIKKIGHQPWQRKNVNNVSDFLPTDFSAIREFLRYQGIKEKALRSDLTILKLYHIYPYYNKVKHSQEAITSDNLFVNEQEPNKNNTPSLEKENEIPQQGDPISSPDQKEITELLNQNFTLTNQIHFQKIDLEYAEMHINDLKQKNQNLESQLQNLPREIIIKTPTQTTTINLDLHHHEFPTLLTALSCKLHIMLVGMASSSKTTSAKHAAQALNIPFYHMGAALSEFKFAGYEDGHGKYHPTPFRMAFENGGLILLDEYDSSVPAAQMFIQSALANQTCHFPDKIIESHPDFYCICAGNTYGRGADRLYTARNQQDAAALDRFVVLNWDIDEDLEMRLFGDENYQPKKNIDLTPTQTLTSFEWVKYVQSIRHAIIDLGERHLVTMRASDYGSRLLKAGLDRQKVEEMTIWKGLNPSTIEKICHHAHSQTQRT